MKIRALLTGLFLILMQNSYAQVAVDTLVQQRQEVVAQYITYLGTADLAGMETLFSPNSWVISTSAGRKNALEFFSGFFPLIAKAHTQLHQRFISQTDANTYGARFHLDYQLHDGETGAGEYIDEFVFFDNSAQLQAVSMLKI